MTAIRNRVRSVGYNRVSFGVLMAGGQPGRVPGAGGADVELPPAAEDDPTLPD